MTRRALAGILALALTAFVSADNPKPDAPEPPVRLKKKVRPNPQADKKPDPKKDDEPKEKKPSENSPEPADNEKEILERIEKNIRDSTERLGKKDTGEGTRQAQREAAKDLDALIEHTRRQQQRQQDQPANPGASAGRKSKNQQRPGASSPSRRERRSRPGGSRNQPNPSAKTNPGKNQGGAGADDNGGASKMADLYKDVWGHLPEAVRLEMDTYSRERFMARYRELLKQYYSTIAERDRREGRR